MKKFVRSVIHLKVPTCQHRSRIIKCPVCSEDVCLMCFQQSVEVNGRCPLCKQLISAPDLKQIENIASGINPYSIGKDCDSPKMKESEYCASSQSFLFDIPTTSETITFTTEKGCDYQIIKYATLEKCIQYITSCDCSDVFFTECFALVHPLVVPSVELMELLINRFNPTLPQGVPFEKFLQTTLIPIRLKVLGLLRMWMKNRPLDFKEAKLCSKFDELMKKIWAFKPNIANAIQTQIEKELNSPLDSGRLTRQSSTSSFESHSFSAHERYSLNSSSSLRSCQELESKAPSLTVKNPEKSSKRSSTSLTKKGIIWLDVNIAEENVNALNAVFCFTPLDCAKQLSLKQMELLQGIELDEFLGQGWMKKDKDLLAPNILRMARFSNHIINVVQNKILGIQCSHERAFAIKYFICVSNYLKQLNNFDGMKAVLAGLASSCIYRLKDSWETLNEEDLEEYRQLDVLVAPDNNFSEMRELVKLASPPSIPFIGSILTDLVYTDDGNKTNEGKLINFYKVRSIGSILTDLRNRQKTNYPFYTIEKLREFWCDEEVESNEDKLFDISIALEPTRNQKEISKEQKKLIEKSNKHYESLWKSFMKAVNDKEKE